MEGVSRELVRSCNNLKNGLNSRVDNFMEEVVIRDRATKEDIDELEASLKYRVEEFLQLMRNTLQNGEN